MTIASLHTVRIVPVSSDSFSAWVRAGTISPEQSNKRNAGIESRSQVFQPILLKRAETAVSPTALKCSSGFPETKKRKRKLINKTKEQC